MWKCIISTCLNLYCNNLSTFLLWSRCFSVCKADQIYFSNTITFLHSSPDSCSLSKPARSSCYLIPKFCSLIIYTPITNCTWNYFGTFSKEVILVFFWSIALLLFNSLHFSCKYPKIRSMGNMTTRLITGNVSFSLIVAMDFLVLSFKAFFFNPIIMPLFYSIP